ncbi:hypothetical protein V6C16_06135 [Desulfovibrio sp. 1188_IL3213]|uniref:hypothetical protein n=1 Tax=Desulfovibrio sp. 1188_IL3213 TaxID=3084052 RepID=UPI002FD9512B
MAVSLIMFCRTRASPAKRAVPDSKPMTNIHQPVKPACVGQANAKGARHGIFWHTAINKKIPPKQDFFMQKRVRERRQFFRL